MMAKPLTPDDSPPNRPAKIWFDRDKDHLVLQWQASKDPTPGSWVIGYDVYKNGEYLARAYGLRFVDRDASKARYEVRAVNTNGIQSAEISVSVR